MCQRFVPIVSHLTGIAQEKNRGKDLVCVNLTADEKNGWDLKANLLFLMVEDHDKEFRKNHICKCKNKIIYDDGRWYCEAMQKSRMKNKKIKGAVEEALVTSPFLPNGRESSKSLLEVSGLVDARY